VYSPDLKRVLEDPNLFIAQLIEVYEVYRDALLNRKYYAQRMTFHKTVNQYYEIILAMGTSSTIAAWAFWKTGLGELAWTLIGGLVAVLVILKPIFQLSKEIERFTKLYIGWKNLHYDLKELVTGIKSQETLTAEMLKQFSAAKERKRQVQEDEDPRPLKRLVRKYTDEVNEEIPLENLWRPKSSTEKIVGHSILVVKEGKHV